MKQSLKSLIALICFIALFSTANETKSQQVDTVLKRIEDFGNYLLYRNHDTNYIYNYGDEIAVKLLLLNKYNYFRIRDKLNDTRLRYRPVRDLNLGAGISYKWFALDFSISLGLRNNSEFKNTKAFDFQGRMFSSKQYIATTIQYYKAYKLSGISGVDTNVNEASTRREDIRIINFSLQYLFAYNYSRFSLKAPFVFNEVQRKSAGSLVFGASFDIFIMDADSSIVPPELSNYFEPQLHMDDLNLLSFALNIGYMYSFVYKEHFFLTLGLIPGLNLSFGDYHTTQRHYINPNFNLKIISMNSIGYNGRKFFTGFHLVGDAFFSRIGKKLSVEAGHGKASVFVGYRFGRR